MTIYPPDWKELRALVLQRARNRCEVCGIEDLGYAARVDGVARPVAADRLARAEELGYQPWRVALQVLPRRPDLDPFAREAIDGPASYQDALSCFIATCPECIKTGAYRCQPVPEFTPTSKTEQRQLL